MISANQNFWDAVWSDSRDLSINIVITGTDQSANPVTLTMSNIRDFALDDQITDDAIFQICNVPMRTLSFSFFDEDQSIQQIGLGGASAVLSFGVTSNSADNVTVGTFYINEVNINGMVVSCEAVDGIGFTNKAYAPTITYPATISNIMNDVATQCGLTFSPISTAWDNASLLIAMPPSQEVTCRQMLQYIAQIVGCGIEISASAGKTLVQSKPVSTGKTIPLGGVFTEQIAQSPVRITDVTYNGGNNATRDATGIVINFADNPLMDLLNTSDIEDAIKDIYTTYGNIQIYPSNCHVSSCPAFQTGDIVSITRKDGSVVPVLITHISQSNLSAMDIVCAGDTVEKQNYVIGGKLSSKVNELGEYVSELSDQAEEQRGFIRIVPSQPLISIGKEGTGTSVDIDDDSVTITGSDGATAVLESSQLTAPQAAFKNTKMGNWIWVSRTVNGLEDQNLTLKWVGD